MLLGFYCTQSQISPVRILVAELQHHPEYSRVERCSKYKKGLELTDSARSEKRQVVKELWIVKTHLIGEQRILMSRRKVCIICSVVIGKIGNGIRYEAAKREASLAILFFVHIANSLDGIA